MSLGMMNSHKTGWVGGLLGAVMLLGGTANALSPDDRLAVRAAIHVETFDVQQLTAVGAGEQLRIDVVLEGQPASLLLAPHSLRADDFQAWGRGAGGVLTPIDAPTPRTYRGTIDGIPGGEVAATVRGRDIEAWIRTPDGLWGIQSAGTFVEAAAPGTHVVYRADDILPTNMICGSSQIQQAEPAGIVAGGSEPTCDVAVAEIAIDTDFEYFLACNGSDADTIVDIESVMNAVDFIYVRDVEITYVITRIIVQNDVNDPYAATDFSSALTEFRDWWNVNHNPQNSPPDPVMYDVAHFMTGKDSRGVIGVAWLGVICNLSTAYGLSYSKFTGNFVQRVALTAHELGHNWGAGHCNPSGDCAIMCSSISGCSQQLTNFGTDSMLAITNHRDTRICLDLASAPQSTTRSFSFDIPTPPTDMLAANDRFGESVDASGPYLLVGAPRAEDLDDNEGEAGKVHVFVNNGASWVRDDDNALQPDELDPSDRFGISVAVDGDSALVGAYRDDGAGNLCRDAGAVYAFQRDDDGTWDLEALLRGDPKGCNAEFGFAVDLATEADGTRWGVIGAPCDDDSGQIDNGAIYIFRADVDQTWSGGTILASGETVDGDHFGTAVSLVINETNGRIVLAVGAPGVDTLKSKTEDNAGAVFIYVYDDAKSQFEQEAVVMIEPGESDLDRELGSSLELWVDPADGSEVLFIGAPGNDRDTETSVGAAFVYRSVETKKDGIIWRFDQQLQPDSLLANDRFGVDVSVDNYRAIVGAWFTDVGTFNAGSAYVFDFSEGGQSWDETTVLRANEPMITGWYGFAVDLDSDSVFVGSPGDDFDQANPIANTGAVFIYDENLTVADCNGNGEPDNCDILDGSSFDCNVNGVPDECDIAANPNLDMDGNGLIDGCEDCNDNGVPDDEEIDGNDCNLNGILDECDIASGFSEDLDGNDIPDECEIDCNTNGVPDIQDIANGDSDDCDGNGVPDECDLLTDPDCNVNGILDVCDIIVGTSTDFNLNGVPDECDVDCDMDGLPDDFEIEFSFELDCNENGIPDSCDIADGFSNDDDNDGVPDECVECKGDFDSDQQVGVLDLLAVLASWGPCPGCDQDLNGDNVVDVLDLLLLLGGWGPCV